jgi:RNA polymerase sigma-B factor
MTVQAATQRAPQHSLLRHAADVQRSALTRDNFLRASVAADTLAKARVLEDIVMANLAVADRLALRYAGRGISVDDLTQVARLGLVQAVHRFDLTTGSEFLSYAVPTILGELKRHFRDRGWTIRPPRRIQELRPAITAAAATLTQTLQRPPTRAEIADYIGSDTANVNEALGADGHFTPMSLDRSIAGRPREGAAWVEALGGLDPNLETAELKVALAGTFGRLSERDRLVLRLRLVDDMTQTQIGTVVGVTQMQVSRILARIKQVVRVELAGWADAGPRPS